MDLKYRFEVILSGEVKFPGEYIIQKGETLSSVLRRAGGLTELAYPYGTLFVRQRIQKKQNKIYQETINTELMKIVQDEIRIMEEDISEKEKREYMQALELRKSVLNSILLNLEPNVNIEMLTDTIMGSIREGMISSGLEIKKIDELQSEVKALREKLEIIKTKRIKKKDGDDLDEGLKIEFLDTINSILTLVSDFQNILYLDNTGRFSAFSVRESEVRELIKSKLSSFIKLYMTQLHNLEKIEVENEEFDKFLTRLGVQSKLYDDIFPSLYKEGGYFEGILGSLPITLAGRMIIDIEKDDIVLESGDVIIVPKIPDGVIITGEVNNPISVIYEYGKSYKYYLKKAGGPNRNADKKGIYVLKANGSAESRETGFSDIRRGDMIVVPAKSILER